MSKIGYAGYRFPPAIIQQAVWLYARFILSFRDVEDLLAERGIMVSYETVRRWVRYFGPTIAADLRRRRPKPHSTWHLDEVFTGSMPVGLSMARRRCRSPRCCYPEQAGQAGGTEIAAETAQENGLCSGQACDRQPSILRRGRT